MAEIQIKQINRLALPAIVAGIAEPLISLADTAIIGHLGAAELGGVGIASSFFLLIVWVLAQTKSAISAIVSRSLGKNEIENINSLVPQAILLNILLGFVFFLCTNHFSQDIFQFYEAKGALLHFADEYFAIRSIGFPLTLATFSIFGVFRGLQNTSWAMKISLVGGVVNIVLDFLLVYGIDGWLPSFGVKGAAYASLTAQLVMFLLSINWLMRKTLVHLVPRLPVHPELLRLINMSFDLFIRTIALNIAFFLGMRFATSYGKEYVAAHTMAINIWMFSAFFIDGYSNAGNAIAGKLFGKEDFKSLYKLGFYLTKINLAIALVLALAFLALYPVIGGVFSSEKSVITIFNSVFWMVIISQPVNSVAFTFDGIFKGLGETKLLRNVLVVSTLFGFVPAIYLFDALAMNIYGIWLAFLIWMMLRSLPLILKFHYRYKGFKLDLPRE